MSVSPAVKQWCRRAKELTHQLQLIEQKMEEMSNEYEYMRDEYFEDDNKEMIDNCYAALFNQRNVFTRKNIMSGGSRRTRRKNRTRRS